MASSFPPFLTRLFRPFTSSSSPRMNLSPDGSSTSASATATAEGTRAAIEKCTVAAGCFWGVEHLFRKQFADKGLVDARVGYIGGESSSPGYRAVCTGRTGHAEALQVTFDPTQLPYSSLLEFFYRMHDPTTKNRQGADSGTQYRSGIFYHSAEQAEIARDITRRVQAQWWTKGKIETEVVEAGKWWDAEEYHQLYLERNKGGYECPAHYMRKFPELKDE